MKRTDRKITIIIVIAVAIISIATAIGMLWYKGAFLPSWIEWRNESFNISCNMQAGGRYKTSDLQVLVENKHIKVIKGDDIVWELDKKCLVQSAVSADIDNDGSDELLVLCWRIGRYGKRRPFWVKHDEMKWSQHIYIYETTDGEITAQWMASDIKQDVKNWEVYDNRFLINYAPDGRKSTWTWISWGLERVPNFDEACSDHISIIMVGDVLLHDGVVASCKNQEGKYDFSPLFANTKEVIEAADLAIVNQEVILGGEELGISGYPSFNGPYEVADALVDAGFDIVCHGTNHALDRGKKGIINCLDYWNNTYPEIGIVGIYDSQEARDSVYITEIKGLKLAILNYTYGTNGIALPKDMPYAVNLLSNKDKIVEDLEYAEANADFTIVCPHWGIEYELKQSVDQEKEATFLVENGADLILGTHPHVIEPVEWVKADNGNEGLCYYSLGNYVNWTSGRGKNAANRMVGAMASVTLSVQPHMNGSEIAKAEENKNNAKVNISDYKAIPLVSHVEHERGKVTTYFLDDYNEDMAMKNAIREQDSAFSYEYCEELFDIIYN